MKNHDFFMILSVAKVKHHVKIMIFHDFFWSCLVDKKSSALTIGSVALAIRSVLLTIRSVVLADQIVKETDLIVKSADRIVKAADFWSTKHNQEKS